MTIEDIDINIDIDESSHEVLSLDEIDEMVDELIGQQSLTTYINRLEEQEIY